MNAIKISGYVVKKEKVNDYFIRLVIAIPIHLEIVNEDSTKKEYHYMSFLLFNEAKEETSKLKKGSMVRIIGTFGGNCDETGSPRDTIIIPKSITRGVI